MKNINKAKLVMEGLYDQGTCDMMTDAEAEKLWQLHQMYSQAFDAACDELATSLGYDKSRLSDEGRADLVEETIALTEQFDEDEHEIAVAGRRLERDTPLMLCLKRHHELSEQIVDVRDEIVASGRGLGDDDED